VVVSVLSRFVPPVAEGAEMGTSVESVGPSRTAPLVAPLVATLVAPLVATLVVVRTGTSRIAPLVASEEARTMLALEVTSLVKFLAIVEGGDQGTSGALRARSLVGPLVGPLVATLLNMFSGHMGFFEGRGSSEERPELTK